MFCKMYVFIFPGFYGVRVFLARGHKVIALIIVSFVLSPVNWMLLILLYHILSLSTLVIHFANYFNIIFSFTFIS